MKPSTVFHVSGFFGPFPESVCEGFFVKKHLQNYVSSTSSHLHIFTSTPLLIFTSAHLHLRSSSHLCSSSYISTHLLIWTSTSLLIFTSSHRHLCSCSYLHIDISAHLHILTSTSHIFTSRSSLLYLLRPGAVPPEHHETQPSAEIVRVEGAKCRRECDLVLSGATLCGYRACRGREMQARVRFGFVRRNPAEIVRVEGAKCRRQCDESHVRAYVGSWKKMRTGSFVVKL